MFGRKRMQTSGAGFMPEGTVLDEQKNVRMGGLFGSKRPKPSMSEMMMVLGGGMRDAFAAPGKGGGNFNAAMGGVQAQREQVKQQQEQQKRQAAMQEALSGMSPEMQQAYMMDPEAFGKAFVGRAVPSASDELARDKFGYTQQRDGVKDERYADETEYTRGNDERDFGFKVNEVRRDQSNLDRVFDAGRSDEMHDRANPKGPIVQVNTGDVGAGERPIVDKPERGFERVWDAEAGAYFDRPIRGGNADRTRTQENNEKQTQFQKLEEEAAYTLQSIDDLLSDEDFGSRYGMSSLGGLMPSLPSGGGARVQSRIKQIQGQTFLQAYEKLKGGGVITEIEGKQATQALARALDQNLSEQDARAAFEEFKGYIRTGIERERTKVQSNFKNDGVVPIEDLLAKYGGE